MKKWFIVIFMFLCPISWALSPFFVIKYFGFPENPGMFGDMFGAINALFSGLALAFVVYAVFLQLEELKLQREDLKISREELAKQNEMLGNQFQTMQTSHEFEKNKAMLACEPKFIVEYNRLNDKSRIINIRNKGSMIYDVTITSYPRIDELKSLPIWEKGKATGLSLKEEAFASVKRIISIHYIDQLKEKRTKHFHIPLGKLNLIEVSDPLTFEPK